MENNCNDFIKEIEQIEGKLKDLHKLRDFLEFRLYSQDPDNNGKTFEEFKKEKLECYIGELYFKIFKEWEKELKKKDQIPFEIIVGKTGDGILEDVHIKFKFNLNGKELWFAITRDITEGYRWYWTIYFETNKSGILKKDINDYLTRRDQGFHKKYGSQVKADHHIYWNWAFKNSKEGEEKEIFVKITELKTIFQDWIKFIYQLPETNPIELCVSDLISNSNEELLETFSSKYKKESEKFPTYCNVLKDIEQNHKIPEPKHSKILSGFLQNIDVRNDFIKYFFPEITDESLQDTWVSREYKHIDVTIKGNDFFIIIENKINEADDQPGQIYRYIEIAKAHGYKDEEIFVLYLTGEGNKEPSKKSIPADKKEVFIKKEGKIIVRNYKENVYNWLLNLLDKKKEIIKEDLYRNLQTYREYLEGFFNLKNKEKEIYGNIGKDEELKKALERFNEDGNTEEIHKIENALCSTLFFQRYMRALFDDTYYKLFKSWNSEFSEKLLNEKGKNILLKLKRGGSEELENTYIEFPFKFKSANFGYAITNARFDGEKNNWYWTIIHHSKNGDTIKNKVLCESLIENLKGCNEFSPRETKNNHHFLWCYSSLEFLEKIFVPAIEVIIDKANNQSDFELYEEQ